jgi:hypothetical protein
MAPPQQEPLRPLTPAAQAARERRTQASSARVDRARRAHALLTVARGHPFAQAARPAGCRSGTAVADRVARFHRRGMAALTIAPGRGRQPTSDMARRAASVATAQRAPDRRADGTATWSRGTLQRTVRRGAFPQLGATTIRRVREDAGRSSQRTRTWCPTGTAQRTRTTGVVTVVDPQTEEQRGCLRWPLGGRKRRGCRCGVTTKRVRSTRSPRRVRTGSRRAVRRARRTHPSGAARPRGGRCSGRPPARCAPQA